MSKKKKNINNVINVLDYSNKDLRNQDFSNRDLTNANFNGAILKRCNFSNSNLEFATFDNADLYRAIFTNSNLYSTSFCNADLTRANYENARIYGIKLFDVDLTRTIFDKVLPYEKYDYDKAQDIYNTLKRAFRENGDVEQAAFYYYKQRVAHRKTKKRGLSRFFEWIVLDLLIGYGEKPVRCLIFSIILILLYSIIYFCTLFLFDDQYIKNAFKSILYSADIFFGSIPNEISNNGFFISQLSEIERVMGQILISISLIGFSRKIVRD